MPVRVSDGQTWWDIPTAATVGDSESLFHYTDGPGLMGILESRAIWASSYLALNDASEIKFGFDRVVEVWRARGASGNARNIEAIDASVNALDLSESRGIYVASASLQGDLLNQWRHYAGHRGYAVEIDPKPPLSLIGVRDAPAASRPYLPVWTRVLYDVDEQSRALENAFDIATDDHSFIAGLRNVGADTSKAIELMLYSWIVALKHPAFRDEREARVVVRWDGDAGVAYRSDAAGIIPYVRLSTSASWNLAEGAYRYWLADEEDRVLHVRSIRCGPPDDESSGAREAAVAGMLRRLEYGEIPIAHSEVPFRAR